MNRGGEGEGREFVRVIATGHLKYVWNSSIMYIRANAIQSVCVYHTIVEFESLSIPFSGDVDTTQTLKRVFKVENLDTVLPIYEIKTTPDAMHSTFGKDAYFLVHPDDRAKMQCVINGTDQHLVQFAAILQNAPRLISVAHEEVRKAENRLKRTRE